MKQLIVYFSDQGFLWPTYCSLFSMAETYKDRKAPPAVVFLDLDDEEQANRAGDTFSALCQELPIDIDIRQLSLADSKALPDNPLLPSTSFGRFLIGDLLANEAPDRVLYVDGDTRIVAPLDDVFETDLKGKSLGACQDVGTLLKPSSHEAYAARLGLSGKYFNSGVLLIDFAAWIKVFDAQRSIERYVSNPSLYVCPDQCLLNQIFDQDWTDLGFRINFPPALMGTSMLSDASVLHYLGRKPWEKGSGFAYGEHRAWYIDRAKALGQLKYRALTNRGLETLPMKIGLIEKLKMFRSSKRNAKRLRAVANLSDRI